MEAKEITEEQKKEAIERFKMGFKNVRGVLDTLEIDIESTDMATQTSAVWISGNLIQMFSDFMNHLRALQEQQNFNKLKNDVKEAVETQQGEIEHG